MSEQVTLKNKLLQEISSGVQFLRNTSSKKSSAMCHECMMQTSSDCDSVDSQEMEIESQSGHKSSTKSPRRSRWSRSSNKKSTSFKKSLLSFQPFRSNSNSKEQVPVNPAEVSKTDSLKENAVRSKSSKNRTTAPLKKENPKRKTLSKIIHEQNTTSSKPSSTHKNERTLLEKPEQNIIVNKTPKKEQVKSTTVVVETSAKSVQFHQTEDLHDPVLQVTSLIQKEDSPKKPAPKQSPKQSNEKDIPIVKLDNCVPETTKPQEQSILETDIIQTSQENSDTALMPLKFQAKGRKKDSKSPIPKATHHQHRLKRSFSDPTYPPRKDHETTVLFQRRCQMYHAKVTQVPSLKSSARTRNHSVDSYEQATEKDLSDIESWKKEIQNNASVFSDPSNEESSSKMTSIKYRNSCIEHYYPLLKTKIPEEDVREDGSVTLTLANKNDTNRDSGVVMDTISPKGGQSNDALDDTEIESKDSALNSTCEDDGDFDTLKHKKETSTDEAVDDSTLTRSSHKSKEVEEEPEWDMYALLKKFESVEWDLLPATTLENQTLDLDDCNLDAVPAAVTEIEYYAFRDVEAVSLNNNSKIENADILGKLADLRVINMWGCNLKEIPKSWSALKKLMMLGLGGNRELKYFSPLKHLTNLVWLDLGGCGLTKIPDEVTNMMKLRVLALGGNPGIEIGDEICSLWDLKQLGLNGCELECIPKAVFSLTKLTHLHLDNNYICQISQEIVQLTELEELTVTGNSNISFPKILSQCDTIKCIVVDQSKNLTRVSGTLKSRMKQMPTAIIPAAPTTNATAAET